MDQDIIKHDNAGISWISLRVGRKGVTNRVLTIETDLSLNPEDPNYQKDAVDSLVAAAGHRTPQAARLYVKRTERQRISAARRRRNWVDANKTSAKVRIEGDTNSQNGTKEQSQPIENKWRSLGESNPSFQIEKLDKRQ